MHKRWVESVSARKRRLALEHDWPASDDESLEPERKRARVAAALAELPATDLAILYPDHVPLPKDDPDIGMTMPDMKQFVSKWWTDTILPNGLEIMDAKVAIFEGRLVITVWASYNCQDIDYISIPQRASQLAPVVRWPLPTELLSFDTVNDDAPDFPLDQLWRPIHQSMYDRLKLDWLRASFINPNRQFLEAVTHAKTPEEIPAFQVTSSIFRFRKHSLCHFAPLTRLIWDMAGIDN